MIRVRFAPSPTGYLHLGNVRTALFNYLFAKRQQGSFILRIEDTDRERSKEEYFQSQLEDLRWLGLNWDEGPEKGGAFGPYRQSERMKIYEDYIQKLIREERAYYCYVTEEETEEMKQLARLEKRPPRFDNRGRTFSKKEIDARKARGVQPTVRFKIENPQLTVSDLIRGDVSFNLDDMVGDFVIQRADRGPTFHLAVCVDDGLMQVSHVIRGEDHLSNTPKHILLMNAMGFPPPVYGHLSLIHGPGGEPLSKRLSSVSVREFRRMGYMPEALANYISLLGWSPGENREIVGWEELQKIFTIENVTKSSSNFDPQKLDWVSGQHLRLLEDATFVARASAYLEVYGKKKYESAILEAWLPIFKDNIERFEQLEDRLSLLQDDFVYEDESFLKSAEAHEIFQKALLLIDQLTAGGEEMYAQFLAELKKTVKAKGKNLMLPLRMALTGKIHGPEIKRFFPLLGKASLKKRFERAFQAGH